MLTQQQLDAFQTQGHLTVESVFTRNEIEESVADVEQWSDEFLGGMTDERREWYLETETTGRPRLRKLDNPVFHREAFRRMSRKPVLVATVEQLLGPSVSVFFSQVFLKPPEGGGPKPAHQDNFYFRPSDPDALLTVWVALDDATTENGCLYYADGSHRQPLLDHVAPVEQPFNLRIPSEQSSRFALTPAPVASGGVSIHHGNTLHQSSANRSRKPRRAVAMHFLSNDARLVDPALDYDDSVVVRIT